MQCLAQPETETSLRMPMKPDVQATRGHWVKAYVADWLNRPTRRLQVFPWCYNLFRGS